MDAPIKNRSELRDEIARLKELKNEQSAAIKARFSNPSGIFTTVYSLFSGSSDADGTKKGPFHMDLVGLLSRLLLPITLNKTLFRNSGFLVKAVVGLLSHKASGYINEDSVSGIWDKAKSFIGNITNRFHKDVSGHKKKPVLH